MDSAIHLSYNWPCSLLRTDAFHDIIWELTVSFLQLVSAEVSSWSEREEYLARTVAEKWKIYHYVSLKVRLNIFSSEFGENGTVLF